jgi:hypothetical protein
MADHQLSRTITALAIACALQLASGPANAAKDFSDSFSDRGVLPNSVGSMTPFGASYSFKGSLIGGPRIMANPPLTRRKIVTVPEPAGWLLMLLGFGVLGVAARGGAPDPLQRQREL